MLVALWITPAAWACNEPRMEIYAPPEVRAGDTIFFELSDTLVGAEYAVKVNGETVQTGTDTTEAQGYRGSFEVPDLGSESREVSFDGYVSHPEDGASSTPTSDLARYGPPAATPSPARGQTGQPATPQDTTAPPAAQGPLGAPGASPGGPAARPPTSPDAPLGAGPAGGDQPSQGARAPAASTRGAQAGAIASSPTAAEAAAVAEQSPAALASSKAARRGGNVRDAVAEEPLRRPAPVHAWGSEAVSTSGGFTSGMLVALAVLLLAGLAGGGFARVRARRPTPSVPPEVVADTRGGDLLMEAELQEMVAEHRGGEESGEPAPAPAAEPERELVAGPS
jgi:hypothetical protein